eukprot:10615-Heterococcus_DN1.PRE.1
MRAPTSKSELLSALGGLGYHRQYIKDYAKAYNTLKERLCKAPVLAWPDFAKPFIVYTDGSASGVGGVLAQEQEGK